MVACSCLLVLFLATKFSDSCLLTPRSLCDHFIWNAAACLAITVSLYNRSFWMPMCLQSMPSIQSLTISVYLFVNTMIQGIFCSVAVLYQASYCFKKQDLYRHWFWHMSSLNWYQWWWCSRAEMGVRWEFTTAVPVYSLSMSVTQYGCHPVVVLCNYFAK